MSILLKQIRVHGFRGLKNVEIDLEPTTVIVGSNNSGKTTLLKAIQLALGNSHMVTIDDFFYSEESVCDKIIIDTLFIPINAKNEQVNEFNDVWSTVLTADRITITLEGNQVLSFRTVIQEDFVKKTYKKKQYIIDEWPKFEDQNLSWYQENFDNDLNFYFEEIPFYYIDANRDILDDIKSKTSYFGKLLSSIEYDPVDKNAIEELIKELNKITIEKSEVLTNLETTLSELDTAMDNQSSTVGLTPFTKKVKDLNKGVNINYSEFAMDYHGMGTRSWSSLLVLKSFLKYYQDKFHAAAKVYFPIIAVEEPEAHLHPNAQKKLYSQLKTIPGQKIISTHSNYIAGCAELHEIRSLNKKGPITIVGAINEEGFTEEELRKIKRQVINTRGELFFSKVVILFEGETEEQALPVLTERHFSKTCIELGIDFIGVGGHGNYSPFINFCESLNIDYFIFSDNEIAAHESVINQINNSNKKDITKVVFLTPGYDFEGYLIADGYLDEIKIAYLEIELSKCTNERHKAAKTIQINNIPDAEYYKKITDIKTQFAPVISQALLVSAKALPPKIIELFQKISI